MTSADRARRLDLDRISEMLGYEKMAAQQVTVQYWQREDNDREQATALNNLGMYAFYEFRDAEAEAYLAESCALAEKLGDVELLVKGLVNLGLVHRYRGSRQEAIQRYLRASEIAMQEPMPEMILSAAKNLMIFMDEETYEEISSDSLAAIESGLLRYGHKALAANLGRVHGEMLLNAGKRKQADTVLERAANHASAIDDRQCLAEIRELRKAASRPAFQARLRGKAYEYLASGRVLLAAGIFDRIVASFGNQGNDAKDRVVWLEIGVDCLGSGLWQPACEHLARLYEVAARNGDARMATEALFFLSEAYMQLDDMELAQRSLLEEIQIRTAERNLIGEAIARFRLAGVLFTVGETAEAQRQAKRCQECLERDDSKMAASVWRTLFVDPT